MSQSTNQKQVLERSHGESSSFFNFGDHFSAKIASLLQDFTGLPSTFSRENFAHGPWKKTEINQNTYNVDNKISLQQGRQIMGDEAFEIPVKRYPGWVSSSTNSTPADAERKFEANQNNCNIHRPLNTSRWLELVLDTQHSKAEVEDYRRSWSHVDYLNAMESTKFFSRNEHNSSDPNQKKDSYLSSEMPSFLSSKEAFGSYTEPSKNISVFGDSLPKPSSVDTKNENINNGIIKSFPINNYEAKTSRFETIPWLQGEAERVMTNPFDGQICDGAQTELDLYNFFSRCLSLKSKEREIKVTDNSTDNLKQDQESHLQRFPSGRGFPFSSFPKERTKIHESSLEAVGSPDRVISSFSSMTQRLDHSGKILHTSIQITKASGDSSTSTTKEYFEKFDRL